MEDVHIGVNCVDRSGEKTLCMSYIIKYSSWEEFKKNLKDNSFNMCLKGNLFLKPIQFVNSEGVFDITIEEYKNPYHLKYWFNNDREKLVIQAFLIF